MSRAESLGQTAAISAGDASLTLYPPLAHSDGISVDYRDEPIRDILADVAKLYGLELDLPAKFHDRTSLRLRDVSWRQLYTVLLQPAGYAFYEKAGRVIVRRHAEIEALPPEVTLVRVEHQDRGELATVLRETWGSRPHFKIELHGEREVRLKSHPKHTGDMLSQLASYDRPDVRLNPFPAPVFFPATLAALELAPPSQTDAIEWDHDYLTTEVYLLEHVAAAALTPRLRRELMHADGRVVPDRRSNALIVTAPASEMRQIAAIVTYLDNPRWYTPPPQP